MKPPQPDRPRRHEDTKFLRVLFFVPSCLRGRSTFLFGVLAGLLGAQSAVAQAPRVHDLPLVPEHVHWGYYDARIPPAIHVASGDRIRVETMVAGGLQRLRLAGASEADIPESLKAVERTVTERGPGAHPMSGPILVDGAEPGDSLEVRIVAIEFLHNFGVNACCDGVRGRIASSSSRA